MLKLAEIFEVNEDVVFKVEGRDGEYRIHDNVVEYFDIGYNEWCVSAVFERYNNLYKIKIEVVPEKKTFITFELELMKRFYNLGYRYIVRDESGELLVFEETPLKSKYEWVCSKSTSEFDSLDGGYLQNDFKQIKWEDNEPVKIEDYVKGEW